MKLKHIEPFTSSNLISNFRAYIQSFAGLSLPFSIFSGTAGESREDAERRAKPAKDFPNPLHRIFCAGLILAALTLMLPASEVYAQQATGELRGQVTDELGGLIVGASVTLTDAAGVARRATTNSEGSYLFSALVPGKYSVRVEAHGFAVYESADVEVRPRNREAFNIKLSVALEQQVVTVQTETNLSTASENNAGAIVMSGAEMDALPDDPAELAAALQALAGPSAGPSGGEIFVDGFANSRLPPKNTIREVRINSNPFSAEYSRLGFGRIEILTRPGTEKFHGQVNLNFSNQSFNSRNPFARNRAPYRYLVIGGNLGGRIVSNRASFFIDFERDSINDNSIVNATVLDASLNITPFGLAVLRPLHRTTFSPRFDYQINRNNTLVARYSLLHLKQQGAGIGNFSLPSLAYNTVNTEQAMQLTETAILSPQVINEMRFQFTHRDGRQSGDSSGPTINVLDAFTGGGSPVGLSSNNENRFELQNNTTFVFGHHTLKAGGRLREFSIKNVSPLNFNGTYTFAGGTAPLLDANNQIVFERDAQTGNLVPVTVQISSLERYRRTLLLQQQGLAPAEIRTRGGGATQFSIVGGNAEASVNQAEYSLYIQDEWNVRPNLTLSMGLRYDAQGNVHRKFNLAPRMAFAYAPGATAGSRAKTVIRGGFGIFFDRIGETLVLQTNRLANEQQFVTGDQNILDMFPSVPSLATLANSAASRTSLQLAQNLQLAYIMQGAIGIERQLPLKFVLTATFLSARALHLLRSRNINAPLPGTGIRPLGNAPGNIFEYESSGRFNQNQLIIGLRNPLNSRMSIIVTYILNKAMSDTDGAETFPANTYDLSGEYGRSDLDIRQRLTISGVFSFKYGLSLNPFILASSGRPFNIITGRDTNGDTLFTERPSFAADTNQPGVTVTRFGAFNPNPLPGEQIVPRNYGTSTAFFTINLRVSKTWSFGTTGTAAAASSQQRPGQGRQQTRNGNRSAAQPAGAAGGGSMLPDAGRSDYFGRGASSESRYKLTFSIVARNIFNRTNQGRAIGNINSLLFGRSNSLAPPFGFGDGSDPNAANRRIEAQVRLSF